MQGLAHETHDALTVLTITVLMIDMEIVNSIRAAVETSSSRRRAQFFQARDLAYGLNPPYTLAECTRSLESWNSTGCLRVGHHGRRKTEEWKWDGTIAMGLVAREASASGHPHRYERSRPRQARHKVGGRA